MDRVKSRRAEQRRTTRRRIVEEALRLFVGQGYAATTLEQIADRAGVAVQTVYFHFGNKRGVLAEGLDVLTAGDDEPVPLIERPWALQATGEPDPAGSLRIWVGNARMIFERVAPLMRVLRDAAGADPEMAVTWETNQRQRHADHLALARHLAEIGGLRDGMSSERAGDLVYALVSPETYQLLTEQRRWSPAEWESWVYETLSRSLLRGC
ncbi:TetR/AcrR family transcriptional regulator [Nonomuraea sp. NPDC050478]|uniref:TetR/AcrR family transcriptional regulator n=1 Tax=unclassified Nonomuraea TaxID=2593643 RepID=UPI0011CDAEEF|nr:TetR/AcrR family transcriptional regulator [Nonomuraea sp. C10]TXK35605.1 TetR/AcrR family transcriptional regulator [Nonomuraea sp. C10]